MRKTWKARVALLLSLALLVTAAPLFQSMEVEAASISYETYVSRYETFIKDSRWKDGASWGGSARPKVSSYSASGCAAYAADFNKQVYGENSLRSGTAFTDFSKIQAGDVLHFNFPSGGEHWIVVLERNGNELYTAEGSWSGKVRISKSAYYLSGSNLMNQNGVCTPNGNSYHHDITGIPATVVEEPDSEDANRIYGANRYETSIKTLEYMRILRDFEEFDSIVIANGENYPDALSGSALAIDDGSPILLTSSKRATETQQLVETHVVEGGTVYLLGGEAVVPASLETGLTQSGYNVIRLYGNNRYDTNMQILNEYAETNEMDTLLVCSGSGYADSLSVSASGLPILLTGGSLRDEQIDGLAEIYGSAIQEEDADSVLDGTSANAEVAAEESVAVEETEMPVEEANEEIEESEVEEASVTELTEEPEEILETEEELVNDGITADEEPGTDVDTGEDEEPETEPEEEPVVIDAKISITLIGGTGAVSEAVEQELRELFPNAAFDRIGGSNRYETSANVASALFGTTPSHVVFAYGGNFPDGLSGGPLAHELGAPLLLITGNSYYWPYAKNYISSAGITNCNTLGGPALIPGKAIDNILSK